MSKLLGFFISKLFIEVTDRYGEANKINIMHIARIFDRENFCHDCDYHNSVIRLSNNDYVHCRETYAEISMLLEKSI